LTSGGVLRAAKMKIGDKEVEPVLGGKEVLYFPGSGDAFEGEPKVSISVTDAAGQTVDLPPFAITMSTRPPSWSVEPAAGEELHAAKVVFTITLGASAGIEFSTLKIELRPKQKENLVKVLVKEGKCKIPMPDLDAEHKNAGYVIRNETFKVSAGREGVPPGDWELCISVQDENGNKLEDQKKYSVK
jgi:hypothetical protein